MALPKASDILSPPLMATIRGEDIRICIERTERRRREIEERLKEQEAARQVLINKIQRNYEEDLSSSGSSSHKHCISINRIYDLLHRCGLWRSGHHVP
jgi:phosphopantothenate synthetase